MSDTWLSPEEVGELTARVYAFEWCDCVFESAFGVKSLHATKVGAYRAMRAHLLSFANEDRENALRYDMGPAWNGLRYKRWRVRAIEVSI